MIYDEWKMVCHVGYNHRQKQQVEIIFVCVNLFLFLNITGYVDSKLQQLNADYYYYYYYDYYYHYGQV